MLKQSPSRNHRPKGIKVNILQICLLVAVCFWLVYQVKHSHEKKKEFEAKDANIAAQVEISDGIIRFGRKDPPRVEITDKDEKHAENEEENEGEEEENKHDEDEQERQEIKAARREEEVEDVSGGDGDDEIAEHDREKNDVEIEHEDEFIDEEKEREEEDDEKTEENEDGGGEDDVEIENVREDRDHDAGSRNTHEAREEHYRADDASSEVAHDLLAIMASEYTNENFKVSDFGKDNEMKTSDGANVDKSTSGLQLTGEGKVAKHGGSLNTRAVEEQRYATSNSTKLDGSSLLNSTIPDESTRQSEDRNNPAAAYDRDTTLLLPNSSQTTSNLTQVHNETVEDTAASKGHVLQTNVSESKNSYHLTSEKIQLETASGSNSSEYVDATIRDPLNSSGSTTAEKLKDSSGNLTDNSTDESKVEVVDNWETGRENQSLDSHSINEDGDTALHDPIDAFDSSIAQEEKESRMVLGTLPEIRDEMHGAEEAAAE
ncbi:hypothetical protein Ancab_027904 [Ancistrocladus abbreviatus]